MTARQERGGHAHTAARRKQVESNEQGYALPDIERLLDMPRSVILGMVRAGFVSPSRGARREYRFSFQDLILLRAARSLAQAKLPSRRINRSLQQLRRDLPAAVPLSGLSIRALGDRIIVQQGHSRWQADSGQYLLALDVTLTDGELTVLARPQGTAAEPTATEASADDWFHRGWELEGSSPSDACKAYAHALEIDPAHGAASTNLGRLLHEGGQLANAERVYREALRHAPRDVVLLFNLGVLLEDAGKSDAAIGLYRHVLEIDPGFADCHYNLALLYERQGNQLGAIRHLREYRKLSGPGGS